MNHQGDGEHGLRAIFRCHGISRGVDCVEVNRFLATDGLVGNGVFTLAQTGIAEAVGHPAIGFSADHLAGVEQLPDIGAADLEVGAGGAAENLQNVGGGSGVGCSVGKRQQEFLEGIVLGSVGVCCKDLLGSGGQRPPPHLTRQ